VDIRVREATPSDGKALLTLLASSESPIARSDADVHAMLASGMSAVALDRARLVCAVGCTAQNPAVAHLTCAVANAPLTIATGVGLILPHLEALLQRRGVRFLVHTAIEPWLLPPLLAHGFHVSTRVVSYQLDSMSVPSQPASRARLLPCAGNLGPVVRVDRQAFPPEWHYGIRVIREAHQSAAHFRMAEVDGRTVGYAYGSLQGQSSHLTRLAVLPDFRGQGIGSALLADAIAHLSHLGAWWMTLNTQEENVPAQQVYQAFGFRRVGAPVPFLCLNLPVGLTPPPTGRPVTLRQIPWTP
jgi:ribosomal-protein-alanine N-acetyltransferase